MFKMFTTQLTGLLKRISEKEEFPIEDAARLLAQSVISEGSVYIKGFDEMEVIEIEALLGAEPMQGARRWSPEAELTESDRLVVAARFADHPEAVHFAESAAAKGIPFVALAAKGETAGLEQSADVFIDLKLTKGLLPDETGKRFGFPSSIAGLYAYFLIKMTIDEIISEYEE